MRIPLPPPAVLEAMGIKPIPLFMLSAWIKAATKCGFNVQPLFKEAGIKIDLIRLEDARVSPLQLISLLEQCVALSPDSTSRWCWGTPLPSSRCPSSRPC